MTCTPTVGYTALGYAFWVGEYAGSRYKWLAPTLIWKTFCLPFTIKMASRTQPPSYEEGIANCCCPRETSIQITQPCPIHSCFPRNAQSRNESDKDPGSGQTPNSYHVVVDSTAWFVVICFLILLGSDISLYFLLNT